MLKKIIHIICVFYLFFTFKYDTYGQNLNLHSTKLPFKVYKTNVDSLSIQDIIKSDTLFIALKEVVSQKKQLDAIFWVKIDLGRELRILNTDSIWYLRSQVYNYASLFYLENFKLKEKKFGIFNATRETKSILYTSGIPFSSNSLINNRYLYLKLKCTINNRPVNSFKFYYVSEEAEQLKTEYYSWSDLKIIIPKYLFSGICLILFVLTFSFFTISKKKEFLYYSLYVFWLFVYLNGDVFRTNNYFFDGRNSLSYLFQQIAQVFINLCYVLFTKHYLTTPKEYPKLHKILQIIIYVLVVIIVLDTCFLYFKNVNMHAKIMNVQRFIMTLFGAGGMVYLLLNAKKRLAYFVVLGSFLYMIGALALLFLKKPIYMITGASFEIIIFILGLVYKIHQEQKEKLYFQKESFINTNKALRAQINPHFIFNSLGSIQRLIVTEKKELAIQYLNKFSILTRGLLESSIETTVVLSEEIKLLEKYIELEELRFDSSFSYSINVPKNIDSDAVEIPMFIMQPFVENAIKHGLLPKKEGDKHLSITFRKENKYIFCEVEDNGVGRSISKKTQSIYKGDQKSRGIEVSKKRLRLLNSLEKETISILDKFDDNKNSLGTKVVIKIPLNIVF